MPIGRPAEQPSPGARGRDPEIRVGLLVGAFGASVGGSEALLVNQPDGSRVAVIPAGQTWQVSVAG
ncbi:MAG: hypothetical protein ACREX8_13560, partial [Gammaproteobacteria bacterium]